jgi:hypothetical protein
MNECQKRGHRVIKMICEECGQEVNRATFKAPDGMKMKDEMIQFLKTKHLPIFQEEKQLIEEFIETFFNNDQKRMSKCDCKKYKESENVVFDVDLSCIHCRKEPPK